MAIITSQQKASPGPAQSAISYSNIQWRGWLVTAAEAILGSPAVSIVNSG